MKYGIWIKIADKKPRTKMLLAETDGWMLSPIDGHPMQCNSREIALRALSRHLRDVDDPRFSYEVRPFTD